MALAIALGGTAYAASLPRNSVGSPQVKPNSLKGGDIKESTLSGVLFGSGRAQGRTRSLAANTGLTTILAIPKVGRIAANCGSGSTAEVRFFNTTKATANVWIRQQASTSSITTGPGDYTGFTVNGLGFSDFIVRSSSPKRVTVIHIAATTGGVCSYAAIAESVVRP